MAQKNIDLQQKMKNIDHRQKMMENIDRRQKMMENIVHQQKRTKNQSIAIVLVL
jgi:hypothetical protein